MLRSLLSGLVLMIGVGSLTAQDIHYTQFSNGVGMLSPGLTGVFQGDSRVYAHYRNQWKKVDAYTGTFTGFFDTKINPGNSDKGYFSAGIKFNYDRAGFSRLSLLNPALTGSYTLRLSDKWYGTLGADLGIIRRAFSTDDLQFGDQFDGTTFDPASSEIFEDQNFLVLDVSTGLNLRYEANDHRTNVNFGAGLFHLNQPEQKFILGNSDRNDDYPMRLSAYVDAGLKITDALDLELRVNYQDQSEYSQGVGGVGLKFYGAQSSSSPWALTLGGFGRISNIENNINDALVPYLRIDVNRLSVGVSYDVNVSEFADYTNNQGGLEVWAQYRFDRFKKIGDFKTCRIF